MDWILVTRSGTDAIGAVGFVDDNAAVIVAFYDDADADKNGSVSTKEWLLFKAASSIGVSMKGMNTAEVAMAARHNALVTDRDPSFYQTSAQIFASFAHNMATEALYKLYFSKGVSAVGSGVSKMITSNMVKQMMIKKGFENAVKDAFKEAVGAGA